MSAPVVFLDTETTGVHPARQPWEIAMIRRDPDGMEYATVFFVEVDLSQADLFGLNVGRFYERHPLGRAIASRGEVSDSAMTPVPRKHAAKMIAGYTHGAHVVGAVPNFDTETLAPLLREYHFVPSWHYHLICVEALAAGHLNATAAQYENKEVLLETAEKMRETARPPWKSDDLSAALGVEVSDKERHTALGDAHWAMRIYDAVMGRSS